MKEKVGGRRMQVCAVVACLLLALIDLLIFWGILEGKAAFMGITSRKVLLVLLMAVNLGILAAWTAFCCFIARKNRFIGTAALAVLTPAVEVVLLETVAGKFTQMETGMKMVNFAIAYVLFFLFLLFFQRIRTALVVFDVLMTVYAVLQYYIFSFRGRPFMLNDISSISTALGVAGGYSYAMSYAEGFCLLLGICWLFFAVAAPDKKISRYHLIRKAAVLVFFLCAVRLLSDRSFVGRFPQMRATKLRVEKDYYKKGQLFSLLSQIQYLTVEKPENYSVEAVREIAEKYSAQYDEKHKGDAAAVQPVNLILIMNESWADFGLFNGYQAGDAVTPFLNGLTENTTRGYLLSTVFGGGTADMEYEVLTGNDIHLLEENPPVAYQVHVQKDEYGVASTLKSQGYGTLAMHPFIPTNYNRSQVYPRMQFDTFLSQDEWEKEYWVTERKYVSDQACYDYLEKLCGEKKDGEKLFTFLVTMQNHGGYQIKKYEPQVSLGEGEAYPQAEQYLTLLKKSDEAFENLIRYFEKEPEPTMIVMFGDHWPNIQDGFYDALTVSGTAEEGLDADEAMHLTPFVIWTNYEREARDGVRMSMNYFGSYVMQQAGVKLTDYNKFLLEAQERMPILGTDYVVGADGSRNSRQELPQELSELLNEYQILQYNNVFGGAKKQDAVFGIEQAE